MLKPIITYLGCFVLLWVLIDVTWGTTVGVLIGMKVGKNSAYQEEISRIKKNRDIKKTDIPKSVFSDDEWYEKLPPDARKDVEDLGKRMLKSLNWFKVTFFVSFLVFAITGFLCAFITKDFIPIGFIPALSFFMINPIMRFEDARNLDLLQKAIIILFAQFGACYLFGYMGAWFGRKRDKKRMNNSVEPSLPPGQIL